MQFHLDTPAMSDVHKGKQGAGLIEDAEARRSVEGGATSVTLGDGASGTAGVAAFSRLTQWTISSVK